jgi:hypothetical protein
MKVAEVELWEALNVAAAVVDEPLGLAVVCREGTSCT